MCVSLIGDWYILKKKYLSVTHLIVFAMQSPTSQAKSATIPPSASIVQGSSASKSSSDTVSVLSQASSSLRGSLSSPLKASDIGVPRTPEIRVIRSTDEEANDNGYDSDGLRAPWEESLPLDFDGSEAAEEHLPVAPPPVMAAEPSPEFDAEKNLTAEEVKKMKVSELKIELRKRGLGCGGLKGELVARLNEAVEGGVPLIHDIDENQASNLAGDSFSPGAYWEMLECNGEYVSETLAPGFRSPTVPAGENPAVKKRNYTQKFDRMVFSGKAEVPKRMRNGVISRKRNGEIIFENRPHQQTEVRMSFMQKHKLTAQSSPVHWFKAFLPISNKDVGVSSYSMQHSLIWTNSRASMESAGVSSIGGKYHDFEPFVLPELMKHIGLYLLQALSPSPQVDMKFNLQQEDPVNGNDLVFSSFGSKPSISKRRHCHFKSFFASNDPTYPVPSRDEAPNWKVHPFLKHILQVSKEAVFMGRDLSCDEQTIGFQGNHRDKQRITYKKEGDGFLADTICGDGYTFSFHFRHQSASKKIMDTFKCSPLHARVLGLISQLPDKY